MIGYYAHQHGSGHCRYGELLANYFQDDITVLTSYDYQFPELAHYIKLEDENPDGSTYQQNQVEPPHYLHYSPVGQNSIQKRSLQLLQTIIDRNIKLLIVDVSAEIAALARSSSIPYAYIKLPGDRGDKGHLAAFQGAVFVIAYYPENFEDPGTPEWLRNKTIYLGFQSKNTFSPDFKQAEKIENITVISGKGGNENLRKSLPDIVRRFKNANFNVFGDFEGQTEFPNVQYKGFVEDIKSYLSDSDLIIANCGMNTVSEILLLKKPFMAIPEKRPFEEQTSMALNLVQNGLALDIEMIKQIPDSEILNFPKSTIKDSSMDLETFKILLMQNLKALPTIPQKFREFKRSKTYEYV